MRRVHSGAGWLVSRRAAETSYPIPVTWSGVDAALLAALGLVTCWVYAAVGTFDFVSYDDPYYVAGNPRVHAGLSVDGVRWALTTFHFTNWHPFTWLSYMLDVELFGVNPGAMHWMNLALHLVNTGLVHLVMRQLGANPLSAGFVAALFALHPLHVESVAWISERKGLLSTAFGLGSMALYIRWTRHEGTAERIGCALLLAAGLATKPMLVSWPLLLLLLDWGPLGRIADEHPIRDAIARVREKIDLLLLSAISCVLTVLAQDAGGAVIEMERLGLGPRIENALVGYVSYLQLTIWPTGLVPLHPHPQGGVPLWIALLSGVFLAGVTAAVLAWHRRVRPLAVAWLWYLISLVPVIGIVQVGSAAISERYTYVPLLGPFAALAWIASRFWQRPPARATLAGLGVAALVAFAWLAERQVSHWRSSLALFSHTVAASGPNFVARLHLGTALLGAGNPTAALTEYRIAAGIVPGHPLATLGVVSALGSLGRYPEATAEIEAVLRREPNWGEGHAQLGHLLVLQRQFAAAQSAFARAIQLVPDLPEAHNGMGAAIANAGDPRAAIPYFEQALRLQPGSPEFQRNLAAARAATGESAAP